MDQLAASLQLASAVPELVIDLRQEVFPHLDHRHVGCELNAKTLDCYVFAQLTVPQPAYALHEVGKPQAFRTVTDSMPHAGLWPSLISFHLASLQARFSSVVFTLQFSVFFQTHKKSTAGFGVCTSVHAYSFVAAQLLGKHGVGNICDAFPKWNFDFFIALCAKQFCSGKSENSPQRKARLQILNQKTACFQ